MKTIWKELMACVLMVLVLPGVAMHVTGEILKKEEKLEVAAQSPSEPEPELRELTGNPLIPVRFSDGVVKKLDMEEYLVGVVLAEMPANFETQALRAQAVAARTYAGKAHLYGGKHGDGSICTDSTCCQAYVSQAGYLKQGGSALGVEKVRNAVRATKGQVLTYQGELIEATYFSCSGGSTEDAQAVWGADFPYLRAVPSPGEENTQFYEDQMTIPREKAESLLGFTLPENPMEWIGEVRRTAGDGVATMELGGRIFKGTELRSLLGLRSTCFTASADDRGLLIVTRGYGHRVGMSQYGADAMAAAGKTYREILSYYYQGTELSDYVPPEEDLPENTLEFTEDSQGDIA